MLSQRSSAAARDSRPATQQEAFRVLRSNLQVVLSGLDRPMVLITSAREGEGKTAVCAHLGVALAMAGQRVILVDLDLRRPDLHRQLGGHNNVGFSDVLLDGRTTDEALQFLEVDAVSGTYGLYFLAAGRAIDNPAEILGTTRTERLLQSLATQADIVLIDAPPVLPVADSLVIGRAVTGALLVVEARRTPTASVLQAKDALTRNQTRLLGVVVNKLRARDAPFSYGYAAGDDTPPSPRSR